MINDKHKKTKQPPDIRLAHAFHFTADDLSANRSGYLSRAQQGRLSVAAQRLVKRLFQRGGVGFREVLSICGRAHLEHDIINRMTQRPVFYEVFRLKIDEQLINFPLTKPQYEALAEGIIYRIYTHPRAPERILSIERTEGDCSG